MLRTWNSATPLASVMRVALRPLELAKTPAGPSRISASTSWPGMPEPSERKTRTGKLCTSFGSVFTAFAGNSTSTSAQTFLAQILCFVPSRMAGTYTMMSVTPSRPEVIVSHDWPGPTVMSGRRAPSLPR